MFRNDRLDVIAVGLSSQVSQHAPFQVRSNQILYNSRFNHKQKVTYHTICFLMLSSAILLSTKEFLGSQCATAIYGDHSHQITFTVVPREI